MKKLSANGISSVGIIFILVITGLVGGIGYYVYQTQQNNQTESTVSDTRQPLKQFTDSTKSYTFSYPGDWDVKAQPYREDWSGKVQLTSINYLGGNEGSDPISVSFDNTPAQAEEKIKYYESLAKSYPAEEVYKTITINGYRTLHEHIEYNDSKVGELREDRYLIINQDQSSLFYIVTSKKKDDITNFDATDKFADFTALVNSTKFLR